MPCNLNQRELSDAAAAAVDAAGGVALPFNTIAVSDNQSQGTPGMRASLVSREVIADSIELMAIAHDFDALRLHRRLRQDDAGGADGARADRQARGAALQRAAARRAPRRPRADDPRGVGGGRPRTSAGCIERGELDAIERAACPGAGTCAGQFTANTMAVALDCLGLTELGDGLIPAEDREAKAEAAARAGRAGGRDRGGGPSARAFLDRRALLQRDGRRSPPAAARPTACCTCSRSRARRASS